MLPWAFPSQGSLSSILNRPLWPASSHALGINRQLPANVRLRHGVSIDQRLVQPRGPDTPHRVSAPPASLAFKRALVPGYGFTLRTRCALPRTKARALKPAHALLALSGLPMGAPGKKMITSLRFSWTNVGAPDEAKIAPLYQSYPYLRLIRFHGHNHLRSWDC
jgi:hypothetical protein